MTTQAAMIAEILSDTEISASAHTPAIRSKIAAAIRKYQKQRFWFNESRDITFNTVIGTPDYSFVTIGAEFYTIDGAFLTDGSNVYGLGKCDYRSLEILLDANTTSALPISYAYINRAVRVYPEPDAIYPIRLTGHIKIGVPAADDTADNEWFTEAYDLIMTWAKVELYAHRLEDPEKAAIQREANTEALSDLQAATNSKVGTGTIRSTRF